MDQTLLTQMLSGGGVLAFAVAVWLSQREIQRVLRSIERTLAKLEERSEADDRRSLTATPPQGVPVFPFRRRKHNDTEEE